MPVSRGFWQITLLHSQRLSAFLSIIVKRNAEWIQVRYIFHADEFVLGSTVVSTTRIRHVMLMLLGYWENILPV